MPNDDICRDPSSGSVISPDQRLVAAVECNDVDLTRTALAGGASANAAVEIDASEQTFSERSTTPALFIACKAGNDELVALLLEHGADPNAPMYRQGILDHEKVTCLNVALSNKNIVLRLLKAGADPDNPNYWGEDCTTDYYPLDNAAHDIEIKALLRQFGAKRSKFGN